MQSMMEQTKFFESQSRYSRQLKLLGTTGQQRLKEATVFIAGIGGLGGTTAVYLAAAGVGKLILAHEGNIAEPDLNRQILMDSTRVGEERMACAVENLKRINPGVVIESHPEKITGINSGRWVEAADIVVDARYDFPERYELNRLCVEYDKPMVEAAMYGFEISLTTILPGITPCLSCMYPEQNNDWEPFGFPVLGAVSGIAGCLAAIEVIKVLTEIGQPYYNTLYRINTLNMQSYSMLLKKNPECTCCSEEQEMEI